MCVADRPPFWVRNNTVVRVNPWVPTPSPTAVPTAVPTTAAPVPATTLPPTFLEWPSTPIPVSSQHCRQPSGDDYAYAVCPLTSTTNPGAVYCADQTNFPACVYSMPCSEDLWYPPGGPTSGILAAGMGCGTADNTPILPSTLVTRTEIECLYNSSVFPPPYAVCLNHTAGFPVMSYCGGNIAPCDDYYDCTGPDLTYIPFYGQQKSGNAACGWGNGVRAPTSPSPTASTRSPTATSPPSQAPTLGYPVWSDEAQQTRKFWPGYGGDTDVTYLWMYQAHGPLFIAQRDGGTGLLGIESNYGVEGNINQSLLPTAAQCTARPGCSVVQNPRSVPNTGADVCTWIWVSPQYAGVGAGVGAPLQLEGFPTVPTRNEQPLTGKWFMNSAYVNIFVGVVPWTAMLEQIHTVDPDLAAPIAPKVWWTPWVNVTYNASADPSCSGVVGLGQTPVLTPYDDFDAWVASQPVWTQVVLNASDELRAFVGVGPRLFMSIDVQNGNSPMPEYEPGVTVSCGPGCDVGTRILLVIATLYQRATLMAAQTQWHGFNETDPGQILTYVNGVGVDFSWANGTIIPTIGLMHVPVYASTPAPPSCPVVNSTCTSYNCYVPACNDIQSTETCRLTPLCFTPPSVTTVATTTSAGFLNDTLPPTPSPGAGPAFVQVNKPALFTIVGTIAVVVVVVLVITSIQLGRRRGTSDVDEEPLLYTAEPAATA